MLPRELVPEKEVRTERLSEARSLLETDFRVTRVPTSLEKIDIAETGTVSVEGEQFPCTQLFLESLSHRIEMPLEYAHRIDFELFKHNFDRRKQETCSGVVVRVSRGAAINLCRERHYPARTLDVVETLPEKIRRWTFHEAVVSDRGVDLSWLDESVRLDPRPGDTVVGGLRVSNSETGFRQLTAAVFALRLVCTNGAVVPTTRRVVRWSDDPRVTYAASVRKFVEELNLLEPPREELARSYAAVVDRFLVDREVVALWRRVSRVVGPDEADRTLGVVRQERRLLFAQVRGRHGPQPDMWTELAAYDVHNRVTAWARGQGLLRRRRLEEIGGEMLRSFSVNGPGAPTSLETLEEGGRDAGRAAGQPGIALGRG